MMIKKILIAIAAIVFIFISFLTMARLLVDGGEDTWICVEGEWLKHGAPTVSKPTTGCGE